MSKIYSLVLMAAALLVGTNAWAVTRTAGTFQQLQDTLSAANPGDVIELTADIAYPTNGSGLINITKSITLDGQGHKLVGYGTCDFNVTGTKMFGAVLAVNNEGAHNANLTVTIKNLNIKNTAEVRAIAAFDGVTTLKLENDSLIGWRTLFINGEETDVFNLKINNSYMKASSYNTYIQKKANVSIEDSYLEGFCALYFKPANYSQSDFGNNAGSYGSIVNANNSYFASENALSGRSNDFGIFVLEEVGIRLTLDNCGMNAQELGYSRQSLCVASGWTPEARRFETASDSIVLTIKGDNSHFNLATLFDSQLWMPYSVAGPEVLGALQPIYNATPIKVSIEGGTYSIDPTSTPIYYHVTKVKNVSLPQYGGGKADRPDPDYSEHWNISIPANDTVQQAKQGNVTVYRVVKKAAKAGSGDPLYNLNSDVPEEEGGAGDNPNTSFELSSGTTMELNQSTTEAGYVQVKDNGSDQGTTVKVGKVENEGTPLEAKVNQTLVINNGLDVQGNSQVVVQSGSTLQIGEGGITTEEPENIVIEADEDGAASLLLDPTITVNQTPNLTVKMLAKQIGRDAQGNFMWHRFAMPVAHIDSWEKKGSLVAADGYNGGVVKYPTYLYGWDYANNDWASIVVGNMVPLQGYTLTLASDYIHRTDGKVDDESQANGNLNELQDVTYIFKGNLVGNTNQPLNFSAEGFNFFGNSYTGYIDVLTLIQGFVSNNVEGTVYMWCNDPTDEKYQSYVGVSLYSLQNLSLFLEDWQKEVAPMQTFILRLRGADNADEKVDYASAIWGNPRYGNTSAPAPRRVVANNIESHMAIVVTANGKGSRVEFTQDANYTDAFESGCDVVKYMNENTINLYATVDGEDLSSVVTNSLNGKLLSLQTNDEVNYTMSFKNVAGTQYAILDHATNQMTVITEGNTYQFAAQPNSTVDGRFEIVPIQNMPTDVETVEKTATVKGIYTITGQYVGEDFETLPAGVYVVDGVKIVK